LQFLELQLSKMPFDKYQSLYLNNVCLGFCSITFLNMHLLNNSIYAGEMVQYYECISALEACMKSVYPIETPVGRMHAVEEDGKVVRLLLPGFAPPALVGSPQTNLARELEEYFEGKRKAFSVAYVVEGSAFFERLWKAALAVPYGKTATYAELASAAGNPKAARAAGGAMAANPLPILIPCHRIVYSHGKRQQYQGGEAMKEYLLEIERRSE
jgi:O-6-methylguanine DNA methyltransferase